MKDLRERFAIIFLAAVVMTIGLLWRRQIFHFPQFIAKYGADSLWALLVFLGIRFLAPRANVWKAATVAMIFASAIEFSQLYHAPWIDGLRRHTLGRLVLGDVFNWPDFGAYAAGILLGVALHIIALRSLRIKTTPAVPRGASS